MFEFIFTKVLVVHIIAAMIAVGTVTVTDYLHILGLRDPVLEKRTLFLFPYLSNLIRIALLLIYITGTMMVLSRPQIFESPMFWLKFSLVIVVTINGFALHHLIFPRIEKGIQKKHYPPMLIRTAAFCGSLSVVSWYAIVILAITKETGYTIMQFIAVYALVLTCAYFIALRMEAKRR